MFRRSKPLVIVVLFSTLLSGCSLRPSPTPGTPGTPSVSSSAAGFGRPSDFGASVRYAPPDAPIDPAIAKDFDVNAIQNLSDIEKAYGFTFTAAERKELATDKFVVKNLLDTNIRPDSSRDNVREFTQLYAQVAGPVDEKSRGPQNAVFLSSDVFLNAYNNLFTELLKEMENKDFYPAIKALSAQFETAAQAHLDAAKTDADKKEWTKVRDYFAVPDAIFSTVGKTLTADAYQNGADPAQVQADFARQDATIDTEANVDAFVKDLHLGAASETAVRSDVKAVYEAKGPFAPAVFADEYAAYRQQVGIDFKVDFTQFTPRGTYTSSSLRRQYFRGMKWFIMVPFFLKSPDLTTYAYGISQLLAEHPDALKDYDTLEAAIDFMVGSSDDLMPADYLQALAAGKGKADPAAAAMEYLVKAHDPKIKDLSAGYGSVGTEQSDDVRLKTKGMRFFSGKFILDSYWTGYLTQGDEAVRPGFTQKLPPMASSLEVMGLLGSDYAKSEIPKLDFYGPDTQKAIDQAMGNLEKENAAYTDADWQNTLYTSWLWTIRSLFSWQKEHKAALPRFMQSVAWEAKTLMTASAWWTELRHATILYAKQSFAELGGGGGCDSREVPPPPKGYVEPQLEAYAKLSYLAKRTDQGLKDQKFDLMNLAKLESFISVLDTVQAYVKKELADATLSEKVVTNTYDADPSDPNAVNGKCVTHQIEGTSDWETLRRGILSGLLDSLPVPLEGPVLSAKDRRAALVADVHTGGDSGHPTRILYEGEGVPYVIFTAVDDVNGPRLTVGFTSSHYEFTQAYGGNRLTDEDWQKDFYQGDAPDKAYEYAPKAGWPKENAWYAPLFDLK
jgi:hypothetical protein